MPPSPRCRPRLAAIVGFALATVAYTFIVSVAHGAVHPLQEWPMISDLWVVKPTNMIARCVRRFLCPPVAMLGPCG